jgi:hypothetical protein
MSKPYSVTCADGQTLVMGADSLDEAGRLFLSTPGAADIVDNETGRFVDPFSIPCVESDYARWHEEQEREKGTV